MERLTAEAVPAGAVPRGGPGAVVLRGGQGWLIALLLALAVVAWVLTDDRMTGMEMEGATELGSLGFFTVTWIVMMAAMMFPSVWPMVAVHRLVLDRRRERGEPLVGASSLLVAGYLAVWTLFGLGAYALIALARSLDVEALAWDRAGRWVAAGVIAAAAAYQLTPLKDVCLSKCRGPMQFVMGHWRPGRLGALRMGAEHGAWCVGCCWALMAALFAVGVMSIAWMAVVAALIALEKLLPWKGIANRAIAAALLALALAVALVPEDVPGLMMM